ncbi:MAG: Jag N-terminal domain-containing protein, partial [Chloroflexi bacterium]|nr:Jag N-terminal domain-containing protein [Chloroflexota bacterium]
MQARSAGKSLEVRAKSVDLAIKQGLAELGVGRDEAEIVVLREGSRGVLGIGAEDAVVRITVKSPSMPASALTVESQPPAPAKEVEQPSPKAVMPSGEEEEEGEPAVLGAEERVQVREIARKALQGLLDHMGILARVETAEQGWQSANAPEDA